MLLEINILKLQQNKKGQVLFELHQKLYLFLHLAAEKKTPLMVQLKQIFGPSYFVRVLVGLSRRL